MESIWYEHNWETGKSVYLLAQLQNIVWKLQTEGYKGTTTNKLQGDQGDKYKLGILMVSKVQGSLI